MSTQAHLILCKENSGVIYRGKSFLSKKINRTVKCGYGRGDKIRTCDSIVPNDVRYQTALHLVMVKTAPKFEAVMAEE